MCIEYLHAGDRDQGTSVEVILNHDVARLPHSGGSLVLHLLHLEGSVIAGNLEHERLAEVRHSVAGRDRCAHGSTQGKAAAGGKHKHAAELGGGRGLGGHDGGQGVHAGGGIGLEVVGLTLGKGDVDGGHFDIRGCDFIFERMFGENRIF